MLKWQLRIISALDNKTITIISFPCPLLFIYIGDEKN